MNSGRIFQGSEEVVDARQAEQSDVLHCAECIGRRWLQAQSLGSCCALGSCECTEHAQSEMKMAQLMISVIWRWEKLSQKWFELEVCVLLQPLIGAVELTQTQDDFVAETESEACRAGRRADSQVLESESDSAMKAVQLQES